ncbi:MAG TPA: TOPRIM nucleotidyl transferase/hydrolase domain-containing protein [Gaiellaceae bacterium]|nr:TOPRIM nucleotidyl transferase/hydrolase domain-containing protein [Gaiellaceae bacterium]
MDARAIVLVEGPSDRLAVETLAERRGRDLAAEGVLVLPIGGAHALGNALRLIGPREITLAGLCDAGEEREVARALERAGLGAGLTRATLAELGFFVCDADLEDELIRALGVDAVERVLAENGDLSSFRTFQKQPQWRGRPVEHQLRRFFGSSAGKVAYARPLVQALDLERVPPPLDGVLARV